MRIYDISQEVFSGNIYPGDIRPSYEKVNRMIDGDLYNLTNIHMCVHNGTHMDAPYHFYELGKTIDKVSLEHYIGPCSVIAMEGLSLTEVRELLEKSHPRILIKGNTVITAEIAQIMKECNLLLVGVEGQSVGPEDAPMEVHLILLGIDMALLEGIILKDIEQGDYFLSAAPLKLGDCDGAPCRAILIDFEDND